VRIEPSLDRGRLQHLLWKQYGLTVTGLTFVPYGMDSWSYIATCRDGNRVFVKLARSLAGTAAAGSVIPLIAALAGRRVPVPRPIARLDRGFLSAFEGYEVQVLEYIDGHNLENETAWPDGLYGRLAAVVAAVHTSTGAVRHLVQRTDDYELPFLRHLVEIVTVIDAGGPLPAGDGPALTRLRELVAPRVPELQQAFGRLGQLRDLARERETDQVLCHTDIWGSNLIQADAGTLYLIDWNGALLGPPEHDLFMFAGTVFFPAGRFRWFLERYEAAFEPVRLDPRTFGYYFYRRNLEDLAGFVGSIAEGRIEAFEPTETLAIVERLLASLPLLGGRIDHVAEVLGKARRD
jgi:Ser/Thr protein kinase RdoA (MazF antagonist)